MSAGEHDNSFEIGLALFNEGRFFECHEAWELAWKRASGADKVFCQGLIQAAVAILHAERGNWRGAISVYKKACARLNGLPAVQCGLALDEFRQALASFFAAAASSETLPPRPLIRRVE